jgi:hypothetical protein
VKVLFRGRLRLSALGAVLAAVAGAGAAMAAYPDSNVAVYTGCLNKGSSGGQISNVADNPTTPLKPCNSNQVLIHLSGGTITKVSAGSGLTGGGSDGAVTLSLAGGYQLPQSCSDGQAPKESGGSWTCGNFANANQSCTSGQFTNGVGSDGSLSCAATPAPSIWTASSGDFVENHNQGYAPVTLSLPAGTYFVTLTGSAFNTSGNNLDADCYAQASYAGSGFGGTLAADWSPGGRDGSGIAGSGIVSDTSDFSVSVSCYSFTDGNAINVTLSAIRVGTVTDQSP